jgi:serine/threonine kinase 38
VRAIELRATALSTRNLCFALTRARCRKRQLEESLQSSKISSANKEKFKRQLQQRETEYLRKRRMKLTGHSFETVRIIGRGAFGEVRLVRMKGSRVEHA